ncbi:hypothetical protein BRADI_1g19785v3 [Brachypodium distachyon]|uniref:Uncharacterized protein n=1 Tax=Brachypodium distachyon TaxID=15368 RepID=A0A0Q3GVG9_BRADI|nr:hypothetical protein BRADI_1g19785v3 [Brachypodium distachyon]
MGHTCVKLLFKPMYSIGVSVFQFVAMKFEKGLNMATLSLIKVRWRQSDILLKNLVTETSSSWEI